MTRCKDNIELLDILRKKKELLLSIFEIALKQQELLINDNVKILLEAIQLRQNLIYEIFVLDSILDRNKLINDKLFQSKHVNNLLLNIKDILKKIADLDSKNCLEAEKKVEEYREQIRNFKQNKDRLESYNDYATNSDGLYIDKKK